MKYFLGLTLLLLGVYGCQEPPANQPLANFPIATASLSPTVATVEVLDTTQHLAKYRALKARIRDQQAAIRNTDLPSEEKLEQLRPLLSTLLIDSIFPYWVGTPWDFNGYTETPRKGVVACGYFVSTTVRDLGFRLNRYRLAQKGAADIAKQLCGETALHQFSSITDLENYLSEQAEGDICILGLDFHVGFVFRKDGENYFAHSNYINRAGVMIETFAASNALRQSEGYWVGNMSANSSLLKEWLQ